MVTSSKNILNLLPTNSIRNDVWSQQFELKIFVKKKKRLNDYVLRLKFDFKYCMYSYLNVSVQCIEPIFANAFKYAYVI